MYLWSNTTRFIPRFILNERYIKWDTLVNRYVESALSWFLHGHIKPNTTFFTKCYSLCIWNGNVYIIKATTLKWCYDYVCVIFYQIKNPLWTLVAKPVRFHSLTSSQSGGCEIAEAKQPQPLRLLRPLLQPHPVIRLLSIIRNHCSVDWLALVRLN